MPRIYVSQTLVDQALGAGRIQLDGDLLRLDAGGAPAQLFINPAVFFKGVDGGGEDPHGLVGCVKTAQELAQLGAEHYDTSVVMGDCAYTVIPGFLGIPVGMDGSESILDPGAWSRLMGALQHLAA